MGDSDFRSMEYVYDAFYSGGLGLTYNFGQERGGYGGRGFGMPTYASLILESDGARVQRSYLATETNYRILRAMETDNLVVPVVGENVATLPIDSTSMFIRSFSQGSGYSGFRQQSPYSRSVQLVCSVAELLKAFSEGRILNYYDVIQASHQ